ncbi:HAMP domain-containing sensor histidine kinase [Amycolatopsis minnesotensis]|uniref:Signal transduction histidine-protein kinase/phosphatase MprB n=1 Tax=Amycolatopsis minnesotensis TaxID=337894 RepID=A0ABP5C565_9PSEU
MPRTQFARALRLPAGLLLARRSPAPMDRLTKTAGHIARTEDLRTRVEVSGRDEVGRLGSAVASMTAALRESRHRQHRLVTGAAHELRTPLTSLRTNVDLLVRVERTGRALPAARRERVLDRLQAQAGEFSDLVGELVELARDGTGLAREQVEMRTVIDKAVRGAAVRDRPALQSGPAHRHRPRARIPEHQRGQVFERFWRAPGARALPGSGLGLAIVASTVAAHGGSARFVDPPGGSGACARVELPTESAPSMNGNRPGEHDQ